MVSRARAGWGPRMLACRIFVQGPGDSKAHLIEALHFRDHCPGILQGLPEVTKLSSGALVPPATVPIPAKFTLTFPTPPVRKRPSIESSWHSSGLSFPPRRSRPDRDAGLETDSVPGTLGPNRMDL